MKLEPLNRHTIQPQAHSHKLDYQIIIVINKIAQIAISLSSIYSCIFIGIILWFLQITSLAQIPNVLTPGDRALGQDVLWIECGWLGSSTFS